MIVDCESVGRLDDCRAATEAASRQLRPVAAFAAAVLGAGAIAVAPGFCRRPKAGVRGARRPGAAETAGWRDRGFELGRLADSLAVMAEAWQRETRRVRVSDRGEFHPWPFSSRRAVDLPLSDDRRTVSQGGGRPPPARGRDDCFRRLAMYRLDAPPRQRPATAGVATCGRPRSPHPTTAVAGFPARRHR